MSKATLLALAAQIKQAVIENENTAERVGALFEKIIEDMYLLFSDSSGSGGSGSTSNYENLINKPSINLVELVGNKTAEELGLASADAVGRLTAKFAIKSDTINTDFDILIFNLANSDGDNLINVTESNAFPLTLSGVANFECKVVNCVVINSTGDGSSKNPGQDITITLPTGYQVYGWKVSNGMTFTTIAPGKSGEFNFLFIPTSKTIRILGEVLV